jgi:hypothetical protein
VSTGDRSVPVPGTTLTAVNDPSRPVPQFPQVPDGHGPAAAAADAAEDDAEVLEALEADLVAVEEAVHTLDRIAGDGIGGTAAAEQINSVVSAARFPDGAPVTEVDLTHPDLSSP